MWAKAVFWLRLGAVVWVTLVGIGAALRAADVIPPLEKLEPWVWVGSLVILGIDNAGTLVSRKIHSHARERDAKLDKAMMGLLIELARSGRLRFEDLGVSVFQPGRLDRLLNRGKKSKRLVRTKRFRPSDYPQQSDVDWRPGKGAVGKSWSLSREVKCNWHQLAEDWADVDSLTDDQFDRIKSETRMNFSKAEFLAVVGKYSEVLAVPVWHRKKNVVIGVLSIDRAYRSGDATFSSELDKKGTREVAAATATVVSRILFPNGDKVEG